MKNRITRDELNKSLREFAIEDMSYARDGGEVAIAQTLRGTVTLKYANTPFIAYEVLSASNVPITGLMSEEDTIQFIVSIYDTSGCEVVD